MKINTIYGIVLFVLYVAFAMLFALGVLCWFGVTDWKIDTGTTVLSLIFAVISCLISATGFKKIKTSELGVVLLWGKPVYSADSGYVLTPFPYNFAKMSRNIIELRFPDSKIEGKESEPILITHGTSKDASAGALGYIQKTPVSIIVRFRIIDLLGYMQEFGEFAYFDNVSTTELSNRIREAVVSKMIDECRKGTLAENQKRLNEIEQKLKLEVESITKNHGVEITTTRIEDIDLGDISTAYREAAVSEIKKEKVVHEADGERIKRILEAMGTAEAKEKVQIGEAKGIRQLANELGIETGDVYKLETMIKAMKSSRQTDISVYGENIGDALKLFNLLKDIGPKQG